MLPLWISYIFHWLVVFLFTVAISVLVLLSNLYSLFGSEVNPTFDFVVVGGGSAGAIVALRLSEITNVSVLLIEAGIDAPDILNIPVLGPLKQTSKLDWQYKTISQNWSCYGLSNSSSLWPMGKVLGGSTHLNFMIYLKGHENDYKGWKHPHSNEWSMSDINKYFNKAKSCTNSGFSNQCNKKGSIPVRESVFTTDFSDAILKAASEMGYNLTDLNANNGLGFMKPHVNIDDKGKRWTSDQNLKDALSQRINLNVVTNAVVERVLLRNGYEAYGVRYRKLNGVTKTIFATEEIILSAGTIGTAKILMLSGIGPKDLLERAKIKTQVDLPVGKNLQDHITSGLDLVIIKESIFTLQHLTHPMSAYDYFVHGRGPYTSAMVEAIGLIHSDLVNPATDSPDLQFMVMMAGSSSDDGLFSRYAFGITDKLWNDYFALLKPGTAVSILPVLLHPKSIGEVQLNPEDPRGPPLINPRYLSDARDIATLTKGIRIIEKLLKTKAMKDFGAKLNTLSLPGCEHLEFDTDDYWECYLRHLTLTSYHPAGTCRMGIEEAVVDHRLKVYRTNKLRVIDGSIMPTLPSANVNAAVVMIAEKGSDLVKEDYYSRRSSSYILDALFSNKQCRSLQKSVK